MNRSSENDLLSCLKMVSSWFLVIYCEKPIYHLKLCAEILFSCHWKVKRSVKSTTNILCLENLNRGDKRSFLDLDPKKANSSLAFR